jgi:hypothetical protein
MCVPLLCGAGCMLLACRLFAIRRCRGVFVGPFDSTRMVANAGSAQLLVLHCWLHLTEGVNNACMDPMPRRQRS